MSPRSIALRLSLWYLIMFALGALILGAGLFGVARTTLLDIADTDLHGKAIDLRRWIASRSDLSAAELQTQLREKYKAEYAEDRVQIVDLRGNLIYRSQFYEQYHLPTITPGGLERPAYDNYRSSSDHFRIVSEHMQVSGHDYIFSIARPMDEEFELLLTIRRRVVRVGILTLIIAAIGGYWISRRFQRHLAS